MAAYGAVVSLLNTIEQIQNFPRISFAFEQKQIESLFGKVDFLLGFVEGNTYHGVRQLEAKVLESEITCAAYVAEDVIESHIVDHIHAESSGNGQQVIRDTSLIKKSQKNNFWQRCMECVTKKAKDVSESHVVDRIQAAGSVLVLDLQEIIQEMDSIMEKVIKFKEQLGSNSLQQSAYSVSVANSSRPLVYTTDKNTMIGFDEELIQLMDELTGHHSSCQIISIVGMGGMGKTTLARNVYENLLVVQRFDIRAWVTIAHNNRKQILLQLLSCLGKKHENNDTDQKGDDQLGEQVYKGLCGRRYLIVLDDSWSTGDWDSIKSYFPNNDNGSRILITTRQTDVAISYSSSSCFPMKFLDQDKSWRLFCEKAFGQASCPTELEKIGKEIAKKCKGLPLSISVIGGLLRKSSMTQEYWENIADNINSILNSAEDLQCSNVLSLSYSHLPVHLKPCFLYMGIFPEDHDIKVSRLIKLWVAEGFLKPNKSQTLEEIANDYLKDLIDRNLILIRTLGSSGKIKTCNIHDLIRDLCLRIGMKEKFLCVMRKGIKIPEGIERERRIVLPQRALIENYVPQLFDDLQSASLARSLICNGRSMELYKFRLLRVLNEVQEDSIEGITQQVNLRYFACKVGGRSIPNLPFFSSLLWNLQTLIITTNIRFEKFVSQSQIWEMAQLRHVELFDTHIPDPPSSDNFIVLRNLQTLMKVVKLRFSEEVCKRIPNVTKLSLHYDSFNTRSHGYYCFNNLELLHKLESLTCSFSVIKTNVKDLTFPTTLKKLCLTGVDIHWEEMTIIGSLPHLEVLKLGCIPLCGPEWNPVDGQFIRLKLLKISHAYSLRCWNAESSHFPVLEKLVLKQMKNLDDVPYGIGEIPTLRLIQLHRCSDSAAISAMKIVEEQKSLGNEGLRVRVKFEYRKDKESFKRKVGLDSFTSNNFQLDHAFL